MRGGAVVLRKIKLYFKRKKFKKLCPDTACKFCPYYYYSYDCKCYLAVKLGLEEV